MDHLNLPQSQARRGYRWLVLVTGLPLLCGLGIACGSGLSSPDAAASGAGGTQSGSGTGANSGSGASNNGSGAGAGSGGAGNGGTGNGGTSSSGGTSASGGAGGNGGSGSGAGGTTLGPGGPALGERASANVLFSGHSLLDNPIPDFVAAIAERQGDDMGWEQQNVLGSTINLRTRGERNAAQWSGYSLGKNRSGDNRNILAELANPTTIEAGEKYDTLVIAERYDPLHAVLYEDSVGYLLHYHDRMTEQLGTARTLFYQVWPDMDKSAPAEWIAYTATEVGFIECMVGKVNSYLESVGRTRSLAVIPGGYGLGRLVEAVLADQVPGVTGSQQQKLDILFDDNVHVKEIGKYFIAALQYAFVFGKTPVGANGTLDYPVPAETAPVLEQLAWDVARDYVANGQPLGRTMEECRPLAANDVCPAFYGIWNEQAPDCTFWSGPDSPLRLPDSNLPFPPP